MPNFRTNPVGIVPKKAPGKFRTISNLSFPTGSSVNDFISKEDYSLSYVTVDSAIDYILSLGPGCYLSKVDIESAFRIIPVHKSDWSLQGISWREKFYYDKNLTMGGRSSPYLFDCLSHAIEWILINNYDLSNIAHLLDDFICVESINDKGNALSVFLNVFRILGIPVAQDKIEGPLTTLDFLGITLDTIRMEARLSEDKIMNLKEKLRSFLGISKTTKHDLMSLIGSLSFACRVVPPGRSFLSRMITLCCTVREKFHKIYINRQVKEDIQLWLNFLENWNGRNMFLMRNAVNSPDFQFFTDASSEIGYGAFFQGEWFAQKWRPHQSKLFWSMPIMELFPIFISSSIWGSKWSQSRIVVHSDNEATVQMLNKGYCGKEPAASMLREIMFNCMKFNFTLKACFIEGKKNITADLLSRFRFAEFFTHAPDARRTPIGIPETLLKFG